MKRIDHITIQIGKKPFGQYKVISQKAFENDVVCMITFQGQKYIWIPTWPEVGAIIEALYFVENLNRVNRGRSELSFLQHLEKMKINKEYLKEVS